MGERSLSLAFEGRTIAVRVDDAGDPWWFADEVCAALGIADHRQSTRHLDPDEKGVSTRHTPGGPQSVTTINEAGLYSLILRSRKPEAKRFKRWVTHEVLPTIRKTGSFGQPTHANLGTIDLAAFASSIANAVSAALEPIIKPLVADLIALRSGRGRPEVTGGKGHGIVDVKEAVRMRREEKKTLSEIADHFGVTKQAISLLLSKERAECEFSDEELPRRVEGNTPGRKAGITNAEYQARRERYKTIEAFCKGRSWPSAGAVKKLLVSDQTFTRLCVKRVGTRVLIDSAAFDTWAATLASTKAW